MKEEIITPIIAQKLLGGMRKNYRALKPKTVEKYKRAILAGEWKFNGECIKIDESGIMIDGQHRCHAVVLSKQSIKTWVLYNAKDDIVSSLDCGTVRNFIDHVRANDDSYTKADLAVARMVDSYPETRKDLLEYVEQVRLIVQYNEGIALAAKSGRAKTAAKAAIVMAYYSRPNERERLEEFVEVLHTGNYTGAYDEAASHLRIYAYHTKSIDFVELFERTQGAIIAFLARKPIGFSKRTGGIRFPIKIDSSGDVVPNPTGVKR